MPNGSTTWKLSVGQVWISFCYGMTKVHATQRLRDAAVIGGIFRMTGRDIEWLPAGISNRVWIAVGVRVADRGEGPPGPEVKLGVHAGGGRVCRRYE
jgi:hypothetical protein